MKEKDVSKLALHLQIIVVFLGIELGHNFFFKSAKMAKTGLHLQTTFSAQNAKQTIVDPVTSGALIS